MHFSNLVVAAVAALSSTVDARAPRYTCNRDNYAIVSNQLLTPVYFCKFWLLTKRPDGFTPIKQFRTAQLTNLCHCIVQNNPQVTEKPQRVNHKLTPKLRNSCNQGLVEAVKANFQDYHQFVKWWTLIGNRDYSPIKSIRNARAVYKACDCIKAGAFESASTSTSTITAPTDTTTTADTTTTTADTTTTTADTTTTTSDTSTTSSSSSSSSTSVTVTKVTVTPTSTVTTGTTTATSTSTSTA